jgi:hypothetical protein
MREPKTKTIFRMFRGEVFAMFPEIAGDMNAGTCQGYAHTGQHSTVQALPALGRLATPAEFRPLARELRRIGYRLDIRKRATRKDYEARLAQVTR